MFSVPFAPAPLRLPFLAPSTPTAPDGVRVDTARSRRIRPRYVIVLLAVFALMATLAVGVVRTPRSEAAIMVDGFASALYQRDVAAAAALTSYPAAAAQTIDQIFDGLGPLATSSTRVSQFIGLDDTSGFFTLDTTWDFNGAKFGDSRPGDSREWHFTSQGTARKLAVGWRIAWDPSVLMPSLGKSGSVQYTRTDAKAPLVLAASGAPMMAEAAIARIDLDPSAMPDPAASTQKLADVIDVVAPLITSESMLAELAAAQGGPVTAVTLRGDDYAVLEDDLRAIDGVKLYTEPALLATDRRLDSPVLDSLRTLWQQSRDATSGWAVDITDASADAESQTLRQAGFQGPSAPDIKSTIDPALQLAAETAVVNAPTSASIVAIRPSDGAVVAVAQNSYANDLGTPALDHLKAAGTLADVVDGSRDIQGTDFGTAAKQLGLGTTYDMPGVHAVTAALGTSSRSLSVTPFGLAQMSAAIANGSAPTPKIVDGSPATVSDDGGAIPSAVLDRLRSAMRDNAAEQGLDNGVIGLNGTNDADDRWFTGVKGDLAFSIYIDGADGSDQATNMAARLLSEMATPSE